MENQLNAIVENNSNKRKQWIDCLRAIAMIFVVIIHAAINVNASRRDIYNVFTGPIMLPLFFAVSGYLFNVGEGKGLNFFNKMGKRLVIPWIMLSLIWLYALLIPVHGFEPYFTDIFLKFISGETLWYFSCCIIAEIIQFIIVKLIKNPKFVCLADIICCAIGFTLAYFNLGNFLNVNKAFIAQFFIMLGYVFRKKEDLFSKINWKFITLFIIGYILLAVLSLIIFPTEYMDFNMNWYPNIPYYVLFIAVGVIMMFLVAKKTNLRWKPLVFVGQNTLFVYAMHWLGFIQTKSLLAVFGLTLPSNWLGAIILTICSLIWCSIIAVVINKFLPFAVGKSRKK